MDKFPNDFTPTELKKFRDSKQKAIINNIRKYFYDTVVKDSKSGLDSTTLKFPTTLNRAYRITLCKELIVHFQKIIVTFEYKRPELIIAKPTEKTFWGYPDDEFLHDFIRDHNDKSINIKAVTIDY